MYKLIIMTYGTLLTEQLSYISFIYSCNLSHSLLVIYVYSFSSPFFTIIYFCTHLYVALCHFHLEAFHCVNEHFLVLYSVTRNGMYPCMIVLTYHSLATHQRL